jgi:hypothetical protein
MRRFLLALTMGALLLITVTQLMESFGGLLLLR